MAFSETVKQQAIGRSGGRCECERLNHLHFDRCALPVNIHSKFATRSMLSITDTLSSCEVLCVSCDQATAVYDRS